MRYINIHNLVNPETGKTWKQENAEKVHAIPIGTLVEIKESGGVRLYVVHHGRDCDMTPLYSLCHNPDDTEQQDARFYNHDWVNGFSEDSLEVIQ